jgi:diacylglycerol kinase (ATP)
MSRTLVLINPTSGRGLTQRLLPQIRQYLAPLAAEFRESRSAADLVAWAAQAVYQDYQTVVAVGGDGTIHYVLTGLAQAQQTHPNNTALGIIPLGRGNDIARTLQIPTNLAQACATLCQGKVQLADLAATNQNYYLGVAGVGFDAIATRLANETSLHSNYLPATFIYTYAVLRVLSTYRPQHLTIEHDQGTFTGMVMLVAISNGQFYGGGMRITPRAQVNDGLLDICIVKAVSKTKLLWSFPQVFLGSHTQHPYVEYIQTREVRVTATTAPLELFGDGEYLENTPFVVTAQPARLRVIIP